MSAMVSLSIMFIIVVSFVLCFGRFGGVFLFDKKFTDVYKGIATLIILYHHSRIYLGSGFWYLYGGGDAFYGVSMFLFISGFGLYKSQEINRYAVASFFRSRVIALLPGIVLCMVTRDILIEPLCGGIVSFHLDWVTLLGFREWFIVAIWVLYVAFIVSYSLGRDRIERGYLLAAMSLLLAVVLLHTHQDSRVASMWLRFPFSFMLGVFVSAQSDSVLRFIRERTALVILSSGLPLAVLLCYRSFPSVSADWIQDLLIIPFSLSMCCLMYRLGLASWFWSFLGKRSLPIYLLQIPLIQHGIFLHAWRNDVIGLIVTWAVIVLLASGVMYSSAYMSKVLNAVLISKHGARQRFG